MKRFTYLLPFVGLIFYSCNSNDNTAVDKDGNSVISEYTEDIDLPENPCEFLTEEMVTSNFDVKEADELKLNDKNKEGYSIRETCFYTWKKENYDELKDKRSKLMMSAMVGGEDGKKASMSDVLKVESPVNKLGVGRFRKYDDMQDALTQFTNLHRTPTKKDMENLNKEIDKAAEKEGLNRDSKKAGKDLTKGIGSNLKFTKVDGIGDQAFYDHLDKRMDVRFGNFSFSILISTEKGLEKDIEIAKKLAQKVWDQL